MFSVQLLCYVAAMSAGDTPGGNRVRNEASWRLRTGQGVPPPRGTQCEEISGRRTSRRSGGGSGRKAHWAAAALFGRMPPPGASLPVPGGFSPHPPRKPRAVQDGGGGWPGRRRGVIHEGLGHPQNGRAPRLRSGAQRFRGPTCRGPPHPLEVGSDGRTPEGDADALTVCRAAARVNLPSKGPLKGPPTAEGNLPAGSSCPEASFGAPRHQHRSEQWCVPGRSLKTE